MAEAEAHTGEVKVPSIKEDAAQTTLRDEAGDREIVLIELLHHGSVDGPKLVSEALMEKKPDVILVDSLSSPEGRSISAYAEKEKVHVQEYRIPPFSQVIADKAGITPRGYMKLMLGPKILKRGSDILSIMKDQALLLDLHPGVVHAMVAEFNIEIAKDRKKFSEESVKIGEILLQASVDLTWHRVQSLEYPRRTLAVFAVPFGPVFSPDYKPAFTYTDEELAAFEYEVAQFREEVQSREGLPGKLESVLRLMNKASGELARITIEEILSNNEPVVQIELLTAEYNKAMEREAYLLASLYARELVDLGEEKGSEMAEAALKEVYSELFKAELKAFAGVVAEVMYDTGLEDSQRLVVKAQRGYWELLNSFQAAA